MLWKPSPCLMKWIVLLHLCGTRYSLLEVIELPDEVSFSRTALCWPAGVHAFAQQILPASETASSGHEKSGLCSIHVLCKINNINFWMVFNPLRRLSILQGVYAPAPTITLRMLAMLPGCVRMTRFDLQSTLNLNSSLHLIALQRISIIQAYKKPGHRLLSRPSELHGLQ